MGIFFYVKVILKNKFSNDIITHKVKCMKNTNRKLLIQTEDIEVYSNVEYDVEFLNRLASYYTNSKHKILHFFGIDEFRKVVVNLFDSKLDYQYAFKDIMQISSYGIGNCYIGEINYVCTKEDLCSVPKAGFVIASIVHEFVHLVYYEKVTKNKCVWLEEGLAQYLSGQKSLLEIDNERYKVWLEKNVLQKEFPKIEYLKEHGSTYGKFCDMETGKYNGYDVSYALIRYIVGKYSNAYINEVIRNDTKLKELEGIIIKDYINETKESAK